MTISTLNTNKQTDKQTKEKRISYKVSIANFEGVFSLCAFAFGMSCGNSKHYAVKLIKSVFFKFRKTLVLSFGIVSANDVFLSNCLRDSTNDISVLDAVLFRN